MTRQNTATKQRVWKYAWKVGRIALVSWLGLVLLAACFYPYLLYHPDRKRSDHLPSQYNLEYENLWLTAPDGVTLNAWRIPAENAETKRVLLAFHGNAGNLSLALPRLRIYHRLGVDVYMIDYHGFGESGGSPSEENLYMDAETVWRHLVDERGHRPEDIVILGYSLGGAVAAWLAERHPDAAALVLESTFTRLSDVAAKLFPWLPCRLILGDKFDTAARLDNFSLPLLVIHGEKDELVPYECGQALFNAYKGRKTFLRIADDHNMGFLLSEKEYSEGLQSFLNSLRR